MDAKLKRKWIRALRSGAYVQGRKRLVTQGDEHDTFCCLGVLVDVATGFDENPVGELGVELNFNCTTIVDTGGLPESYVKSIGAADLYFKQSELICMNDGATNLKRSSFNEIADWIEANVDAE